MTAPEAKIEQTDEGMVVTSPGWFVVNMADSVWTQDDRGGEWSTFGEPEGEFEQYGIGIHVLRPGQVNGLYHSESVQEDFLVLSGECLLLVEEEERQLKAWDFMHFAPGTRHICIGAGDGPCAILMVGARGEGKKLHYPVTVAGTANVFEANVTVEILGADGKVVGKTFTTASCGTGCRGKYSVAVPFKVSKAQLGAVLVHDDDAAGTGTPPHSVQIPVTLLP